MPYIWKDELGENEEAVDVVTRDDYNGIISERDAAISERDTAIDRAVMAENAVKEANQKYADHFFNTNPESIKNWQNEDVKKDGTPQTFNQLFEEKGSTNAY